ncbi:hypothetical protein EDB85DRAFT_533493 [Lactarius pseudohatsudake]|nr:hypothetical protein EDB85DRAFT_533493 [Lactarius pseudohatsudake]
MHSNPRPAGISFVPTLHFAGSADHLSSSSAIPHLHITSPHFAPLQSPMQHSAGQTSQVHSLPAGESVYTTHSYVLKTDYAFVSVRSRARNVRDIPLMYLGEETIGTVVFPEWHLREVWSITIVVSCLIGASETVTKLMLSSEQVRRSHTSNGEFCWHFTISPPTTAGSSSSTLPQEQASSSLRHPSRRNHNSDQRPGFQLQLTIHRRGCFARKIRMRQPILYIPRPGDPSTPLPLQPPAGPPRNLPLPWAENMSPEVIVRGVIFGRRETEVECRLIIPESYPVNDTIPLRLNMTCEDHEALDLFAAPHVIDVRLLKVLAFGRNAAAAAPPFSLRNRESYHITNWVATALWNVDGHAIQENGRWHIRLNGRLLRDPGAEISHIFSEPGMALMYYVCLFPFRSNDFRPLCAPDRILFYGRVPLTE